MTNNRNKTPEFFNSDYFFNKTGVFIGEERENKKYKKDTKKRTEDNNEDEYLRNEFIFW